MSALPPYRLHIGKDSHRFSAAHVTVFPGGTKERLHGHNFQVSATVDLKDVSFASFFDFALVKRALDEICREWDERVLLAERCPFMTVERLDGEAVEITLCGKRYRFPADEVAWVPVENIVVETLAEEAAARLLARLREALSLDVLAGVEVAVFESPGQGATCALTL